MEIGPYTLQNNLILAPMAGVTDRPFRQLCKRFGAGMAVSEMVSANPLLRNNKRTLLKLDHCGESEPITVQIFGADPAQMAESAKYNVDKGAQIIDINMGCPAKKVCNTAAGSALLRKENLVGRILDAVVAAVDVPVTLKIRTGWDKDNRNALSIAALAENAGIKALAIHGRTRACGYSGVAEFETITQVKQCVQIPIIANGDIDSAEKAKLVLQITGADAIMIARAAQGRPWIFQEIGYYLEHNQKLAPISLAAFLNIIKIHLAELYEFYGPVTGVRIARKHIGWYLKKNGFVSPGTFKFINHAESPMQQLELVEVLLEQQIEQQI